MVNHSLHQSDLPVRMQILNISVNMARAGELVLKSGIANARLIKKLIDQTESYLSDLASENISKPFKPTLIRFGEEFVKLKTEDITEKNRLMWAERAITWADILQMRSKLLT